MPRNPDAGIGEIARRQHGVITTGQLEFVGVRSSGITDRVAAGRLHRVHRGVYAVGHAGLGNEGRWMAAVLSFGRTAVLSHRSAARLWRMISPKRSVDDTIDVTVRGGGRARRPGVKLHRSRTLDSVDSTRRNGIPVTTPARTLKDLRRSFPSHVFASALREAEFLRLPIEGLDTDTETPRTRTDLEALFMALVRRHRLPRPEVNARVDRYEVDFLWRSQRLIVEVDGWESHRTRSAFEEDRARDARLKLLGFEVLRFTWRQVENERRGVAGTIRALLARDHAA
jgi:very-short-patch-repair endonuclease